MPLVSLIIPCFNHHIWVHYTIESALAQKHVDKEVIVVNDGSTDRSLEVIKQYADKIKIVDQPNSGLASARNAGLRVAQGEFILPMDSDDAIDPFYISKTLPFMEDPRIGVVGAWVRYFGLSRDTWVVNEDPTLEVLKDQNQLCCTALIRRAALDEVGGWNPAMDCGYEDWNLWIDIAKRGWKFKMVQEFLFWYRIKKTSMITEAHKRHDEIVERIHSLHPELYA